jgi:transcriptional regulator with XRE-family HTH domain
MADVTGVHAGVLSQIERGERLPRPRDIEGLERGYGPQEGWYSLTLEAEEES